MSLPFLVSSEHRLPRSHRSPCSSVAPTAPPSRFFARPATSPFSARTAITSTGTAGTVIRNGNVGLSPGADHGDHRLSPGRDPEWCDHRDRPVTAQARRDLVRARIGLAGMPANANLSTVDLVARPFHGSLQIQFGGHLERQSGPGRKGAKQCLLGLQIGTSLTTSINSTVRIINPGSRGGSDYGIFWNCGSAINIGGNNQIAGIICEVPASHLVRAVSAEGVPSPWRSDVGCESARCGGGPAGVTGAAASCSTGRERGPHSTLSFSYFGETDPIQPGTRTVIRGEASPNATRIQWRTNGERCGGRN